MLRIEGARKSSICLSAVLMNYPFTGDSYVDASWGPLFQIQKFLVWSLMPSGVLPTLNSVGFATSDDAISINIRGDKPVNSAYGRGLDDWRFGKGYFPSQVKSYPRPRAEKEVLHTSFTGTGISTKSLSTSILGDLDDEDDLLGVKMPQKFSTHRLHSSLYYDGDWSLYAPFVDGITVRNTVDVHRALLNHQGDIWTRDSYPGYPHAIVTTGRSGEITPNFLSLTFSGQFRLFPFATYPSDIFPHAYVEYSETIKWYYTAPLPIGSFLFNEGVYFTPECNFVERTVSFGSYSKNTYPYSVDSAFSALQGLEFASMTYMSPCFTSTPLLPGKLVSQVDDGFNTSYTMGKPSYALDTFVDRVQRDIKNLLPATFYSSADAIDKHVSVLESNNLENFTQLGGLAELIPDVGKFISALQKGKNGDLLGAGATIFDLWSENRLREDFGWNPAVADVRELSDKYSDIVRALTVQDIWGQRTLYGKFNYELPDDCYGFGPCRLSVRTKVRVSFEHSSLLATLIKGKAIGIIPSLANLWDLVPFSFVADWLWNIGDRLGDIDSQLFMLLLPVHFAIHSITVSSPLRDPDLEFLEIQPNPAVPLEAPGVRFYMRIPSLRLPVLAESRYDFRSAHGPSSLLTAGALACALAKA